MYNRGTGQENRQGRSDSHVLDANVVVETRQKRTCACERERQDNSDTQIDPEHVTRKGMVDRFPLDNRLREPDLAHSTISTLNVVTMVTTPKS